MNISMLRHGVIRSWVLFLSIGIHFREWETDWYLMIGGIFELLARGIMVTVLAGPLGFLGICLCDPGAWLAALIPLVPVYIIRMKKIAKTYTPARSAGRS